MNKMILVVSPEEACRMLNGDQSLLVRKINPRKLPCECNIYCTKDKKGLIEKCLVKTPYRYEYTVRKIGKTTLFENDETFNGKVVAKFTLNKVERFNFIEEVKYKGNLIKYNECIERKNDICKKACLSAVQMVHYLDTKALGIDQEEMVGYAWHIEDLVVFDKPKKLEEFSHYDNSQYQALPNGEQYRGVLEPLTRVSSTYCYVEM